MALEDLHDDEIKARLGLPIERERDYEGPLEEIVARVEDRIEALAVASMPEEFDPETEVALELLDMTQMERVGKLPPICTCPGARYEGDPAAVDPRCPVHREGSQGGDRHRGD